MKRPDKRYKTEAECDEAEIALIEDWFKTSHRSNWPADRAAVYWRFDPQYGAVLADDT